MSLFGQVWLWSLLAFVAGVLLTWLVLVRPAQARNRMLERRLLAVQAAPALAPEPAPTRAFEPGPEADSKPGSPEPEPEADSKPDSKAGSPEAEPEPEPEPERRGLAPQPHWYERESYGSPVTEQAEPGKPLFSSPASSVLEPESEHRPETQAEKTAIFTAYRQTESGSLFESGRAAGSLFEPAREPGAVFDTGHEAGSLFEPAQQPTRDSAQDLLPPHGLRVEPEEAVGGEGAAFAHEEKPAEPTQVVLPKRQPKTPPRSVETQQPSPPSMRAIERREPVPGAGGGRSGSLFEPAVRPSGGQAESVPPARTRSPGSVPPGPFGPASAMPRPGGGRPADEFTVKASVAALRYCTEDSPQFARMVAEVWFRTPADAERVGFRPF